MSNEDPRDNTLVQYSATTETQRNNQKINDARKKEIEKLQAQLEARLNLQEKVMGEFRKPESSPVGGLVGKYMHLADLNVETLAGQTIAMILYDILSFLLQHEHGIDRAIYNKAGESGIAYTGDEQPIYKMGKNGKPDFENPYLEDEEPSLVDIYKNGYVPEANLQASILKEMGQAIQGVSGVKPMGEDLAIQMFGVNATNRVYNQNAKKHGDDASDRLVSNPKITPP